MSDTKADRSVARCVASMLRGRPRRLAAALLAFGLAFPAGTHSALADMPSPVGKWKTYDDKTHELRSVVEIVQVGDELQGKVVQRFPPPGDPLHGICGACDGPRKNQPILGMTILWGVKHEGDDWTDGSILDPIAGKVYNVRLKLEDGGQSLSVHGYVGISLLGRTVLWTREN